MMTTGLEPQQQTTQTGILDAIEEQRDSIMNRATQLECVIKMASYRVYGEKAFKIKDDELFSLFCLFLQEINAINKATNMMDSLLIKLK